MPVAVLGDVNIHHEVLGQGSPVVLAHGFCANVDMWRRLAAPLSERYRVISYDARGHGLSTAPAGTEHYGLDQLVEDMRGLVDHLGIESAIVAGHSMGGATAIGFAARYPERTRAALICNIDGGHQPPNPRVDRAMAEARERARATVRERGTVDYARRMIEERLAPRFVLESEVAQRELMQRYARMPLNGYFGVGETRPWTDPAVKQAALSLQVPAAIFAGSEDHLYAGAQKLHEALPQSFFAVLDGAPHDSMNARPDAFNAVFLEYLDSLEQGAPLRGRRRL